MIRKRCELTQSEEVLNYKFFAGGDVLGLLQTEHSGIGFNLFVNASHTDAERHCFGKDHPFPCESRSFSHGNTRASLHCGPRSRITFTLKSPSGLFKVSYLGSVRAVTNQWGSPLYMFDYDVFGQPLQDRPERYRHGFTGKEYDSWTGLYNYGFRDYSAMFGRFTSVDPIQDGHNWYAYVNSDPVSWLDPWGLEPCKQKSGEDPTKYTKIVSDQKRLVGMSKTKGLPVFDYNNFTERRVEGEFRGIAAGIQDIFGKIGNFFSNIFSGKAQVETYYSVSVSLGPVSYDATMYVSKAGVSFEFPEPTSVLTTALQNAVKMPIILEEDGVSGDIPVGTYYGIKLSIPVSVSKKEDNVATLKLGGKISTPIPLDDSLVASASTGYRITASIQDGPCGTIKNRKSKALNTNVSTYEYYTSADFFVENFR